MDGDTIVILGLDIEIDGIGPRLARIGRYADDDGYLMILGACHLDDTLTDNLDTVHALDRKGIALRLFGGIHDLEVIDVLDTPVIRFTGQC